MATGSDPHHPEREAQEGQCNPPCAAAYRISSTPFGPMWRSIGNGRGCRFTSRLACDFPPLRRTLDALMVKRDSETIGALSHTGDDARKICRKKRYIARGFAEFRKF
jgi:hypothetical protein